MCGRLWALGVCAAILAGCASANQNREAPECSDVSLAKVAKLSTHGNAGWEAFFVQDQLYIAAANFWDGESQAMEAQSPIYTVSAQPGGNLSFSKLQKFTTRGAHGWDYFKSHDSRQLLVVPNYYHCGSNRGPAADSCKATVVYSWEGSNFKVMQAIATAGPAQTDHFVRNGETYLVIGENFNDEITIWRLDTAQTPPEFRRVQALKVAGAGGMAVAEIGEARKLYLVAASYHDARGGGWSTKSPVFAWHDATRQFDATPVQLLAGNGAHDAEMITFEGSTLLFLSEDRSPQSSLISSQIFRFDEQAGRFGLLQKIPTDGAHGAEFFEAKGSLWLAVANFGDRLGKRYKAKSALWRFDAGREEFRLAAEFKTTGATDMEHFAFQGCDYLAVANEGDLQGRKHAKSPIFRLDCADSANDGEQAQKEEL